jgi:hypothetical protein
MLTPLPPADARPLFGGLKGTVLRFDDPFAPAANAEDWHAGA